MTRPTVTVTAERLYEALGTMQDGDEAGGWPLLRLCDALTASMADVEALVAETATQVAWRPLLDPTLAPAKVLPYLAQWVGAVLTPGLTEAQQRATILASPGRNRGTVQAIKDAAKLWLAGSQLVTVNERPGGDAYAYEVVVYAAQVTDLALLTSAMNAAKPAGLTMTLTVLPGWTVADMEARYAAGTVSSTETIWSGLTVADFEREAP